MGNPCFLLKTKNMKKNTDKLNQIASKFEIMAVRGHRHVVSSHVEWNGAYPDPDYLGQNKALVGIIENQTIDQFCESWVGRKAKN